MEINREALAQLSPSDLLQMYEEHMKRHNLLSKSSLYPQASHHYTIAHECKDEYNKRVANIFIF